MKKFAIAITILLTAALSANAQESGVTGVVGGGYITISTDGADTTGAGPIVGMVGLDVASSTASLVPYEPAAAPVHGPFLFFLSNTPSSIVMAAVPAAVDVADDQIKVGYTGTDGSDLTLSYGDAASQQVSFPATSAPVVPEPATGLMAAFAALGLLGFRSRR